MERSLCPSECCKFKSSTTIHIGGRLYAAVITGRTWLFLAKGYNPTDPRPLVHKDELVGLWNTECVPDPLSDDDASLPAASQWLERSSHLEIYERWTEVVQESMEVGWVPGSDLRCWLYDEIGKRLQKHNDDRLDQMVL